MTTRTLYRPVGLRELELVLDADARAFPPRLPAQPIFYPVMNAGYAAQIASEWNPTDAASGFAGFVTEAVWQTVKKCSALMARLRLDRS